MPANWGVIEERAEDEKFIAYHVVPMIDLDGASVMSAVHILTKDCPCGPVMESCGDQSAEVGDKNEDGTLKRWVMWDHHDPDHPGAKGHS